MDQIEKLFWNSIDKMMRGRWDAQRHEDKYSVGIPDVSYGLNGVNGWIELKAYSKWPTKGFPHLEPEQVNWLIDRGRKGGYCFLMAKIVNTILIFRWTHVDELACPHTEKELREMALAHWENQIMRSELINILS